VRKVGQNRVIAEMCSYKAANKLENEFLLSHNLEAFIPLHRILRTGIVRDIPQNFSIDTLKESISSPLKVLEICRLNRRVIVENELKYSFVQHLC